MSASALVLVFAAGLTGWEKGQTDEGALAHIFQILIAAQVPLILAYLYTADWRRTVPIARSLACQILAVGIALGSVAYFKL
jgi:hypothetical protein